MLFPPGLSRFSFTYDNFGADPSTTPGTSVTPGASNAEGSWVQIASSANIAQDCYWLLMRVSNGAASTAAKPQLLDIGVDPAGGTSYTAVISNIACGASGDITVAGGGFRFLFPIFIKAGSSVAVRIQGANATAGTVRVGAKFYGQPSKPECCPVGMFSETIGTITNSDGVAFAPGNAADGTWTSLGTTTLPLWWWQIACQQNNGTKTGEYCYIELAYGDGSNKVSIMKSFFQNTTAEATGTILTGNENFAEAFCPVPAGSTIYIRGRCNNAPDSGYNAVAIGIGG